jgi:hypothetical protein
LKIRTNGYAIILRRAEGRRSSIVYGPAKTRHSAQRFAEPIIENGYIPFERLYNDDPNHPVAEDILLAYRELETLLENSPIFTSIHFVRISIQKDDELREYSYHMELLTRSVPQPQS